MKFSLEKIKDLGIRNIVLLVFKKNLNARKFYEKLGFELDGAVKKSDFVESENEVRYTLVL